MAGHNAELDRLIHDPLTVHCRNLPYSSSRISINDIQKSRWNALEGDLPYPLLLLKESALASNISLLADYCQNAGVYHAPHAKTPMSPQLVWRLIESGAWGTSIATVDHARVFRRFGVSRLLLANQLIEPEALRWIARELRNDPAFEFWCLVDSVRGVELMDHALEEFPDVKLDVLIEIGLPNGRAGCRNTKEVVDVAAAINRSRSLRLQGVELYEAMAAKGSTAAGMIAEVDAALISVRLSLSRLMDDGLINQSDDIVVTAGGSLYFDRVVEAMREPFGYFGNVKVVLRGGCCVTHEVGENDYLSPLSGRSSAPRRLQQALELWGLVLSRPEPGLAILNFGKRDASFDKGLPVAFAKKRHNERIDQSVGAFKVLSLNDQHARVSIPAMCELLPGDLIGFHIAHPCTAFDKWRLVPVVDDGYGVRDAIVTFF